MNSVQRLLSILFLVCTLMPGSVRAIPILSLVAPAGPVAVGSTFALSLRVDDAVDLYAFQLDLRFDPALISAGAMSEGTLLASIGPTSFMPGMVDNPAGTITFIANSLIGPVPGATGDGTLVEFMFQALNGGTATFNMENVLLLDSAFNTITPILVPGSVAIGAAVAVPEPSTLSLMLAWLCAAALLGRYRIRSRAILSRH